MEYKKRKFIIDHFGCKTQIGDEWVLTSLANSSRVPAEEFWNVFTGDADKYFDIWKTENEKELSLTLDNAVRKYIEREIESDNIAKLDVGFGWKWVNNSLRCYLEDTNHNKKFIPFIFLLNDEALQGRGILDDRLNTRIIDKANLLPVNSGATAIIPENHGGYYIKGGKFGCINKTGRVQIPLIYDDIIVFTNPFLTIAEKDGEKFLINKWGEQISHNFDELVKFYGDFCIAKKNGKYGIIDYDLNVVVPFDYDKILCRPYSDNAIIYIDSHCGLFDLHERKFLVDIAYDTIVEHSEAKDMFSVSINNKWGIIDDCNLIVVPIEYEYIANLGNIGLVKKNGKYGVLDKDIRIDSRSWEWKDFSLNECIPCVYDEVYNTNGEVSHTQSLFHCYRYYFAKYQRNEVLLDCYTTVCHRKNGCADYLTREILTSLNCEYDNIKDTIIAFDKTQSNTTKVVNE